LQNPLQNRAELTCPEAKLPCFNLLPEPKAAHRGCLAATGTE